MREACRVEEQQLEVERSRFEAEKAAWESSWREWDIGADLGGAGGASLSGSALGGSGGLGERVLSEVIRDRSKTEHHKKRKGLF